MLRRSAFSRRLARSVTRQPPSPVGSIPSLVPSHWISYASKLSMVKRKASSLAQDPFVATTSKPIASVRLAEDLLPPVRKGRSKVQRATKPASFPSSTNPDLNTDILDGPEALRASPDAEGQDERLNIENAGVDANTQVKDEEDGVPLLVADDDSEFPLSELSEYGSPVKKRKITSDPDQESTAMAKNAKSKLVRAPIVKEEGNKRPQFLDPEADGDEEADEEEIEAALARPPPVHSNFLPLPWNGRLGYACLCTYLRFSNPPVFSSRTCRIASILENRHPLKNPDEAPHATKNRPDRDQPADVARGQAYVESLGLANARDIVKMLRWNDRYGIKFFRLSSEMFPFASHEEYGYKLAPFASEVLVEAGKVAAELGHRLTTHPGQFTQLGSPRKQVIDNAIRDLEYHAELLSLLKMPPQQDRDAVMILHLGGVFGDKAATLDRFKTNYEKLPPGIKDRLVLENDDVSWSVHDLLSVCEDLNIPMVLDFHHNNIIFDADKIREGTKDIVDLFPRILATWERKKKTPKMHYSEPTPAAITGRQRRKHNPRVATLPPCPPDMDLMIEAKDKEQAVFELMRTFKLPGFDSFTDMIPHVRKDDNKPIKTPKKTPGKRRGKNETALEAAHSGSEENGEMTVQAVIPEDAVGMGGPEGRVYWPPGMEDWLRPVKKLVKKKEPAEGSVQPAKKRKIDKPLPDATVKLEPEAPEQPEAPEKPTVARGKSTRAAPKRAKKATTTKKIVTQAATLSVSNDKGAELLSEHNQANGPVSKKTRKTPTRNARSKKMSYAEGS